MIDMLLNNWEYALIAIMALIGILCIDKLVALSPTEWDDLIWTSIKKSIFKMVGK